MVPRRPREGPRELAPFLKRADEIRRTTRSGYYCECAPRDRRRRGLAAQFQPYPPVASSGAPPPEFPTRPEPPSLPSRTTSRVDCERSSWAWPRRRAPPAPRSRDLIALAATAQAGLVDPPRTSPCAGSSRSRSTRARTGTTSALGRQAPTTRTQVSVQRRRHLPRRSISPPSGLCDGGRRESGGAWDLATAMRTGRQPSPVNGHGHGHGGGSSPKKPAPGRRTRSAAGRVRRRPYPRPRLRVFVAAAAAASLRRAVAAAAAAPARSPLALHGTPVAADVGP